MTCPSLKEQPMSHRFSSPPRIAAPAWPTFTGVSTLVGVSQISKAAVYVDLSLGMKVVENAAWLIGDADRLIANNDRLFGTTGEPVNVIIFALGGATDGTGGADHLACNYKTGQNIEVCAAFGLNSTISALFEAELSECSMGGNLCGLSTGEALSRWCAITASSGPNPLTAFATAPTWASAGVPDFVTVTEQTDQGASSTGCGMAFISWLISLGHDLGAIAKAMVSLGDTGTFGKLYANLTGKLETLAWTDFQAAITALGGAKMITTDDPFATAAPATTNTALDLAKAVTKVIMADLGAGKSRAQLVADIKAAVG